MQACAHNTPSLSHWKPADKRKDREGGGGKAIKLEYEISTTLPLLFSTFPYNNTYLRSSVPNFSASLLPADSLREKREARRVKLEGNSPRQKCIGYFHQILISYAISFNNLPKKSRKKKSFIVLIVKSLTRRCWRCWDPPRKPRGLTEEEEEEYRGRKTPPPSLFFSGGAEIGDTEEEEGISGTHG